jgi:hypothetical protein
VPPDHAARSQLVACLAVCATSGFLVFVFQLLPAFGLFRWSLLLFMVPEVAMMDANIGLLYPIHIEWGLVPGLEVFLAVFFQLLVLAEPVLLAVFLRACALTMKVDSLERTSGALVQMGLGTAFIHLAYLLLANVGTSDVLMMVLRVLYVMGTCFLLGYLLWFLFVLLHTRTVLERVLKGIFVE